MKIFYDMDNTIAEMTKALEGIYSGHKKDYYNSDRMTQEEIVQELTRTGFFEELTTIRNSQRTIRKLIDLGHEVYVLSQPMAENLSQCIAEKDAWLDKHFPMIDKDKRIFTHHKYLLADKDRILIDDNIGHLGQWIEHGGIGICFIRGYNKTWNGLYIKEHQDIFNFLIEGRTRT